MIAALSSIFYLLPLSFLAVLASEHSFQNIAVHLTETIIFVFSFFNAHRVKIYSEQCDHLAFNYDPELFIFFNINIQQGIIYSWQHSFLSFLFLVLSHLHLILIHAAK